MTHRVPAQGQHVPHSEILGSTPLGVGQWGSSPLAEGFWAALAAAPRCRSCSSSASPTTQPLQPTGASTAPAKAL